MTAFIALLYHSGGLWSFCVVFAALYRWRWRSAWTASTRHCRALPSPCRRAPREPCSSSLKSASTTYSWWGWNHNAEPWRVLAVTQEPVSATLCFRGWMWRRRRSSWSTPTPQKYVNCPAAFQKTLPDIISSCINTPTKETTWNLLVCL